MNYEVNFGIGMWLNTKKAPSLRLIFILIMITECPKLCLLRGCLTFNHKNLPLIVFTW